MLKSMTSFGRAGGKFLNGSVTIEIRCVNHRYLDTSIKLHKRLSGLEEFIKKKIASSFSRGRVELSARVDESDAAARNLTLDVGLARIYYGLFNSLKKELGVSGEVDLTMLASFGDLVKPKEEDANLEEDWRAIEPTLAEAISAAENMRTEEGRALYVDLVKRLDLLCSFVNDIETSMPSAIKEHGIRLKQRILSLMEQAELDPMRFNQEIAIIAERSDITEEVVRFKSHIEQFKSLLNTEDPVGRRFDFLIQEMHREANTMGSKAIDASISHRVVDIKSELEKIGEQVQNIE
ncbi:MAG: YicC/YloC family endoribonuclease [Pseudomonadota bacterium]